MEDFNSSRTYDGTLFEIQYNIIVIKHGMGMFYYFARLEQPV